MAGRFTYVPQGIDSVTFACRDVHFWGDVLMRLGFEAIGPRHGGWRWDGVLALAHGKLRLVLLDPSDKSRGAQVEKFMVDHGDMQVFAASILVDDAAKARSELSRATVCSPLETVEDSFGKATRFRLLPAQGATSSWELVQRTGGEVAPGDTKGWKSLGVDHFAIAVRDLNSWAELYQSLGFETIYVPKEEIAGDHSAMKTVALQRGAWVVALVEGVDREQASQVSTYSRAHGDHAIQHAAVRFDDLRATLGELMGRGVQFRVRRLRPDPSAPLAIEDVMHEGKDHSGPLLQCFTKPVARRRDPLDPHVLRAGFFFELIQRVSAPARVAEGQAFHDPTVIGLYRSIEREEMAKDSGLIFADLESYPSARAA